MGNMKLLRSIRMVRLLRLTRILIAFRELYCLICGISNCMKTLMWASGLILLTLTVWSIIAVEFMNPLMASITREGHYDVTCGWCPTAFRSVMLSNLTFFQIISGDGWSGLARPIIEAHPWTAGIFLSVIFMVVFGLLNLVIAAIVDTAAQARENDIETISGQRKRERELTWTTFERLCEQLDSDNSGEITLDELRGGLSSIPALQAYFSVMGVEDDDLREIFLLLDEDGNGELSYAEFHSQLYKMKTLDVKTTLFFVTRYIQRMQRQLAALPGGDDAHPLGAGEKLEEQDAGPRLETSNPGGVVVPHTLRSPCASTPVSSCESDLQQHVPQQLVPGVEASRPPRTAEPCTTEPRVGWYFYGASPPFISSCVGNGLSTVAASCSSPPLTSLSAPQTVIRRESTPNSVQAINVLSVHSANGHEENGSSHSPATVSRATACKTADLPCMCDSIEKLRPALSVRHHADTVSSLTFEDAKSKNNFNRLKEALEGEGLLTT